METNLINEQFCLIQRGIDGSQHSFEILIDAFVHAEQGTLQPQLIITKKIKDFLGSPKLPSALDYPNFHFPELKKIITPNIFLQTIFSLHLRNSPIFTNSVLII